VWATRSPSLLTAELATLLALTFPHARVVAALDGARSARTAAAVGPAAVPPGAAVPVRPARAPDG
jgi:hypothetical protein